VECVEKERAREAGLPRREAFDAVLRSRSAEVCVGIIDCSLVGEIEWNDESRRVQEDLSSI
jgi:hypothetical protein